MSVVTIPAGHSLRAVAERLGVPVDELSKHAGVEDIERPMEVAKRVEVPDGFLRTRPKTLERQKEAIPSTSGRQGGMNFWLAMDIEQKRTRRAGGMKAHEAKQSELDGLAEAKRAYDRFESDSNELAINLFNNLTATHSIDIRAQAFGGQSLALAQRYHLFGEPAHRARPQGLSAAKGSQLADPKLPEGHVGMAMALRIEPTDDDLKDARKEMDRAHELAPESAWVCTEMAALHHQTGDLEGALEWVTRALSFDSEYVLALELAGTLTRDSGKTPEAIALFQRAVEAAPGYANAALELALTHRARGDEDGAEAAWQIALERAQRPQHRSMLEEKYDEDSSGPRATVSADGGARA